MLHRMSAVVATSTHTMRVEPKDRKLGFTPSLSQQNISDNFNFINDSKCRNEINYIYIYIYVYIIHTPYANDIYIYI